MCLVNQLLSLFGFKNKLIRNKIKKRVRAFDTLQTNAGFKQTQKYPQAHVLSKKLVIKNYHRKSSKTNINRKALKNKLAIK